MSGLIALLDDVAAIAKVASASVDDVVGQAFKASSKAAGAVIDDAAVTPKYLTGFSSKRELPIVWKIARGSIFNKLVILLPIALLLASFAPWAIPILLIFGGLYLCFEGAEKVWHKINPSDHHAEELVAEKKSAAKLEEQKVKGAVKTDFILSAEIMTIVLNALPSDSSIWMTAASLAVAAVIITAVVYGSVAIIVKADDVGLHLAAEARAGFGRGLGRGIVKGMPHVLTLLLVVGTAAMIWVGGNIIVHAANELGWNMPYDTIHDIAVGAAAAVPPSLSGATEWGVTAFIDGIIGLILGAALIPLVNRVIAPAWGALFPKSNLRRIDRPAPLRSLRGMSTHDALEDPRNADILIWVNGTLKPRAEAVVSVYDSGFMLGDGIWEGMRLHNGRWAFLDLHLDRLYEAALAIDLDIGMTRAQLKDALDDTTRANGMTDDAHCRLMVTRGIKERPFQHPSFSVTGPTIVIIAEHSVPSLPKPIRLATVPHQRGLPMTQDPKLNSHSKLNCILACIAAEKAGADEALMLDVHGFVNTTNACNFFIVRRGEVWTSTGDYCMNGITRGHVIDLCRANGIPVFERNFSLVDTYGADEAFLTGTFGAQVPVGSIDGRVIGTEAGPLTRRIRALYADVVARDTA